MWLIRTPRGRLLGEVFWECPAKRMQTQDILERLYLSPGLGDTREELEVGREKEVWACLLGLLTSQLRHG